MSTPDELLRELSVPSRLGERPSLDRMRRLLAELGQPHRDLRVLHIGGTSGKGSTATLAARILELAGYRVGLHVKPHLERVEERFVLNGRLIATERLVDYLEQVAPVARLVHPTWYELTVAIAFQFFRDERVDLAVVEVGLGGTYDGTNVVQPLVAILTNVDLDHTDVLGDTVEKIASDKVGIFKSGILAISGATQPSVREIVSRRCRDVGASLWQVGREIDQAVRDVWSGGARFDVMTPRVRYQDLYLRALGLHQVANAALAVAAVTGLAPAGFRVPEAALRVALASTDLPGRLEVVRSSPLVLLDGAHNPAKMRALTSSLATLFPSRPLTAVVAFKRGHDLATTLSPLVSRARRLIITRFDADTDFGPGQSIDPAEIAACVATLDPSLPRLVEPDPIRAVGVALDGADGDEVICVTGSLYLVGAVRSYLRGRR